MSNVETRLKSFSDPDPHKSQMLRPDLNKLRPDPKKVPLGVIVISVVMFFVAFATDIFWLARLLGKAFPSTMPVDPAVYNAFAAPDIVLSIFLFIGAYGLIKLRKYGFMASLVGMGMWLFDSLLVLAITKSTRISFIGPSLFFAFFTIVYLWMKKELFD